MDLGFPSDLQEGYMNRLVLFDLMTFQETCNLAVVFESGSSDCPGVQASYANRVLVIPLH